MNKRSTIYTAKGRIAEVHEASNEAEMERIANWSRAWISCLGVEGLVDDQTHVELHAELNEAMNQVSQRLGVSPLPFPQAGL